MKTTAISFALAAALMAASSAVAQEEAEKPFVAKNKAAVEAWTKAHPAVARGGDDIWFRNGIVADRTARVVELVAETCGLAAGNTVEFLLIGPGSEKGYEAFAQAFAACGDIARAVEFIGVCRGRVSDPAIYSFWSKGERVIVETAPFEGGDWSPIEDFVLDKRVNAPMSPVGFVYTGSKWEGEGDSASCVADAEQPRSVIATYNERMGVFDVPRRAPQGAVYETFVQASGKAKPEGELLLVRMRPAVRDDGAPRVRDFTLRVAQGEGSGLAAARFTLFENGAEALSDESASAIVARFAEIAGAGFDPFVSLDFDPAVTVGTAVQVATMLSMLDGESGVRVEAPADGQPYYRAFLPNPEWRERANRASQPWELRFSKGDDGAWKPVATFIEEDWSDPNSLDPKLTPQDIPVESWDALLAKTKELKGLAEMFVFSPADLPLSEVIPAIRALSDPRFAFHFFIEQ